MNTYKSEFINNNIGMWEWNPQTDEILINNKWAEVIGYTTLELTPFTMQTWESLVHPQDYQKSQQAMRDYLGGITSFYQCDLRLRHKNGEWIWISDYAKIESSSPNTSSRSIVGYHQDITKWKNSQLRLSANQQLLNNIINEMPDVFVLKDAEGKFLICNQTVAELYKTTQG